MDPVSVVPRDIPFHLLEEITENFSEDRKLGSGAYGEVYMGVQRNGAKIAVKVLYDRPILDNNKQQFQKEFANLANLQHPNIVRLVGYCYETRKKYVNYDGELVFVNKTDMALCFEYMHKRSLDKNLADECNRFDWHTSYAIIKGICNGLKYLHEELKPPMLHLDLKPANILLDEKMVPKIADFGLSRLFQEERTRITTSPVGTIGYLPPEYIKQHIISNKMDIFSLGVIIIEIMSGPKGYSQSTEISSEKFIELVCRNWRNRLHPASSDALELYHKQVKICIELALSCVEFDRHKRPTIGHIILELSEKDTMNQIPDALRNEPASWINQEHLETRTAELELEEKRATRRLNEAKNLFGEVVDNYKLDKISSYVGKSKTQQDRAQEALNLVNDDDKDLKASRYVDDLKPVEGPGSIQGTLCFIYNATGDTLHYVSNHDWYGCVYGLRYPTKIGNGQWAAFRHGPTWHISGSTAAVVYRGKNKDAEDQDYLLAWNTPLFRSHNKAYCEIGAIDYFNKKRCSDIHSKLKKSDYYSDAKSDGCEVDTKIGEGRTPRFIARITSLIGHLQHYAI